MGIPVGERACQVVHLDSCILISLFDDSDDRDLARASKHLLQGANGKMEFRASLTALGEAWKHSCHDPDLCQACSDTFHRFMSTSKIKVIGYGQRDDLDVFDHAMGLMGCDDQLRRADALILATSIMDVECSVLYTIDGILLESTTISKYVQEQKGLRGRALSIIEPPLEDKKEVKIRKNRKKR